MCCPCATTCHVVSKNKGHDVTDAENGPWHHPNMHNPEHVTNVEPTPIDVVRQCCNKVSGVVGLSWGDGGMGMESDSLLGDPQRVDEQTLRSTVNVNSRIRATVAIPHTLQASHFMNPLFKVTLLLCSIQVQVVSQQKLKMSNKEEQEF
jgi:hypothetical protein